MFPDPMKMRFPAIVLLCGGLLSCQPMGSLISTHPGPEDFTVAKVGGKRLLLTATDARKIPSRCGTRGRIESFDLDAAGAEFQSIWESVAKGDEKSPEDQFRPAGLQAIPDPHDSSRSLLYVTSAEERSFKGGRVCIFTLSKKGITPLKSTPRLPGLGRINGIVVARDGTIYASNFGLLPSCEDQPVAGSPPGKKKQGSVFSFRFNADGRTGEWKVAAHGIDGANGLVLTPDEKHLLICSYHGKAIHAFERDGATGDLVPGSWATVRSSLPFHPDNIKYLEDGTFSVAGQYSLLAAVPHFLTGSPTLHGGARIFRWEPGKQAVEIKDLSPFLKGDGHAPSTALVIDRTLYVGHIVSPGVRKIPLSGE